MEEWQEKRIDFYTKSKALDFIKNYNDVKKGVRLFIGHIKDMILLGRDPERYISDYENWRLRVLSIPDFITKKYTVLSEYWCVHTTMYTFNENSLEWMNYKYHTSILEKSRVGINAFIDLDTPDNCDSEKANRLTFFDHIEQFNEKMKIIDKKLEDEGQEYNRMFTGNGINYFLNGYYKDNFLDYRDNFVNTLDTLKENGFGDKFKVHICNGKAPWSIYTKIPFTFHDKRERISLPLPKGEIDGKWLDEVSNSNNVMNDYSIINEIIKKSNWKKIW